MKQIQWALQIRALRLRDLRLVLDYARLRPDHLDSDVLAVLTERLAAITLEDSASFWIDGWKERQESSVDRLMRRFAAGTGTVSIPWSDIINTVEHFGVEPPQIETQQEGEDTSAIEEAGLVMESDIEASAAVPMTISRVGTQGRKRRRRRSSLSLRREEPRLRILLMHTLTRIAEHGPPLTAEYEKQRNGLGLTQLNPIPRLEQTLTTSDFTLNCVSPMGIRISAPLEEEMLQW